MNESHNRTYRIEMLLGLLGTAIIVFALAFYIASEPKRIVDSQGQILQVQLDSAMTLYAENCAVCHGLNGEGIGATPPLNAPGLQSMPYDELYKTIERGRFETAMPAWSKEDGGPLNDYQIGELVALIESGDWNETGDRVVNLGLAPLIPFTTDPDPALLEAVGSLADGGTLQTAITIFAAQCVACHGADGLGTGIAPALNDLEVRQKDVAELERTIVYGNAGTPDGRLEQRADPRRDICHANAHPALGRSAHGRYPCSRCAYPDHGREHCAGESTLQRQLLTLSRPGWTGHTARTLAERQIVPGGYGRSGHPADHYAGRARHSHACLG